MLHALEDEENNKDTYKKNEMYFIFKIKIPKI